MDLTSPVTRSLRQLHWCLGWTIWVVAAAASVSSAAAASVSFPGNDPGDAQASAAGNVFTLSNATISQSWRFAGDHLSPATISNKLNGTLLDQSGHELFRLGTQNETRHPNGYVVAIRLDRDQITVLVSLDEVAWTKLASFKRKDFPGDPKLVRIGKMSAKATAEDYPGDAGEIGEGAITEIVPPTQAIANDRFDFKANANHSAVSDFPFPSGSAIVQGRIDKGTDSGMTWAPAIALVWDEGKQFVLVGVRDRAGVFNVSSPSGEQIIAAHPQDYPIFDLNASNFHFAHPSLVSFAGNPTSACLADRENGKAIEADATSDRGITARWRAELRHGSNYIRQTVQISSLKEPLPLTSVELVDLAIPQAATVGTTAGCPVAGSGFFAGVEMPGATNAVDDDRSRIGFRCNLQLTAQPYNFSQVVGVAPDGQLRRSFLYYIERQRARPSKPFLHYNSWYDLGYEDVSEQHVLSAIEAFHRELFEKRHVQVQSFLIDDGWDDPSTGLWAENRQRFPNGLAGVAEKAKAFAAHLGVWISPLGGYGGREQRTDDARQSGLIPATGELDLSYPKYNAWFLDRCQTLMRDAGINAFKWDKAGEGVSPHFMALLGIAQKLHAMNPDLFINVTVGTWPSPFWLNYVDTTWRDGSGDVGWEGKGADATNPHDRERWLTYRDGYCYRLFVQRSPLYPLNSVMHHGIVLGKFFQGRDMATSGANLRHEARSYFANGASLQELYLTPSLMTPAAWDDVATAATWAKANADVLADAHWIGGDPLKLEPYGFAAWNTRKGTLMLRNPDDQAASITIDAQTIFELPAGAPARYAVCSAFPDSIAPVSEIIAGQPTVISLKPFDVVVLEMTPKHP